MRTNSTRFSRFALLATLSTVALASACSQAKSGNGATPTEATQESSILATNTKLPKISVGGSFFGFGKIEALVVRDASVPLKGAIVMSPGAKIPAMAMTGLARAYASKGYAVYIVEYFQQLAIIPTESGKAVQLASALIKNTSKISGLPAELVKAHEAGLPVSLFGHSMGGTVLSNASKAGAEFGLKSIVLLGVSQLAEKPKDLSVPVLLLRGENDGLVEDKEANKVQESFGGIATEVVQGVSHFCIIDDPKVGDLTKRFEDKFKGGGTKLTAAQCQDAVVEASLKVL